MALATSALRISLSENLPNQAAKLLNEKQSLLVSITKLHH
jgi:hypothetical protein